MIWYTSNTVCLSAQRKIPARSEATSHRQPYDALWCAGDGPGRLGSPCSWLCWTLLLKSDGDLDTNRNLRVLCLTAIGEHEQSS